LNPARILKFRGYTLLSGFERFFRKKERILTGSVKDPKQKNQRSCLGFDFESLNGQFRSMFHGKKDTDVELVKSFFFSLETYAAHANHTYPNQMLYSFSDKEANGYVYQQF
jgi:hypothetical protein